MKTDLVLSKKISSSTDVKHRIMKLNALQAQQEDQLKRYLQEFQYAIQPATLIKNAVKGLNSDIDFKRDAVKEGLTIGVDFLLNALIFKKGMGFKKHILNIGLKKIASYFIAKKSNSRIQ